VFLPPKMTRPQFEETPTALKDDRSSRDRLTRLREQEIVLRISEQIATVGDKHDLLRFIVQEIKPIFDFYDCGLFVVSPDGQTHQDLMAVAPEIDPSEANHRLGKETPLEVPHPGSLVEWIMHEADAAGGPILQDFPELWKQYPDYSQFKVLQDFPFRDCLLTTLKIGGESFGMFCLNAHQKNHFQPSQFPLFQQIANQVAIALANLLTKEELEQRAASLVTTNQNLSLRDQWLEATANAAQALLSEPDLDTAINNALRIMGATIGVDRMNLLQFEADATDETLGTFYIRYEWDSPFAASQIDHPDLKVISAEGLEDITLPLMAGDWIGGLIEEFDEPFRSGQLEIGVKSTYAVPIFIGETFWGAIGIDHCRQAQRLTPAEIAVFKTAASCIGGAIQQAQIRADQEAAERRMSLEREQAAQAKAAYLEEKNHILTLREQWLEAIAYAANALLSETELDIAIKKALQVIGESIDMDRVAIMQQRPDPTGVTPGSSRMVYEWKSAYATPQLTHPDLHEISWVGLEDWYEQQVQGQWMGGIVAEFPEPLRSGQIELGVQSTYSVPIFVNDQFWGLLCIDHCRAPKQLTTAEMAVLKTAATCVGSAIHQEQIRRSREAAEKAVLNERNRMAREIHDTLAQSFTGIIMQLEAAKNTLPAATTPTQDRLHRAADIARFGLTEARQSVHALRSGVLESCNLPTALERLVRQMTDGTSVDAQVLIEGETHLLPAHVEDNLLRIGQEALTNALRHAQADTIRLRLLFEATMLHLSITDDGQGFDPQQSLHQPGFGLVGMQERSHLIHGDFHLMSQPGVGTTITVSVETPKR